MGGRYKLKVRERGYAQPPVVGVLPAPYVPTTYVEAAPTSTVYTERRVVQTPSTVERTWVQPAPVVQHRVSQRPPVLENRVVQPPPVVERRWVPQPPVIERQVIQPPAVMESHLVPSSPAIEQDVYTTYPN
ncbi:MAG: hypothetical protein NVSMB9_18320 [Isosphaeraceae bacterium]